MKSLEELNAVQDKVKGLISLRLEDEGQANAATDGCRYHVLVCGGTGCTSSGSKQIIAKLNEEIEKNNIVKDVKARSIP